LINVWNQPWLKHGSNSHVTTPTPSGLENHTVASLIHHENSSWRLDLLRQILNTTDFLAIQFIPFLNVASNDNLIWSFSNNGVYSVCTAYHNLMESMLQNEHLKVEANWHLKVSFRDVFLVQKALILWCSASWNHLSRINNRSFARPYGVSGIGETNGYGRT